MAAGGGGGGRGALMAVIRDWLEDVNNRPLDAWL